MGLLKLVISVALFACLPLQAFADPAASVVQVETISPDCNALMCMPQTSLGSGVAVGEIDGCVVVATCYHVVKSFDLQTSKSRMVIRVRDRDYKAVMIGKWIEKDLALIKVPSLSLQDLPAVEIDEAVDQAADYQLVGFPHGRFARARTRFKFRGTKGEIAVDQSVQSGHSGGGLFNSDYLTGIVFASGRTDQVSVATPAVSVTELCRHFRVRIRVRGRGIVIAPAPPMPTPPAPPPAMEPRNPWLPDPANIELLKKLDSIGNRLSAIEAKAGIPGPVGPAGPQGAAGKDGVNGKDADTADLKTRIAALEGRGIVVQLLDANGAVMSEQKYAPGAPIKLQFNPVKSETK